MQTYRASPLDATKILTRRELAAVLNDLKQKAPRSKNTRLNLTLVRLACCCGLRASEIAKLQVGDVRTELARPRILIRNGDEAVHHGRQTFMNQSAIRRFTRLPARPPRESLPPVLDRHMLEPSGLSTRRSAFRPRWSRPATAGLVVPNASATSANVLPCK
jgi:integrase